MGVLLCSITVGSLINLTTSSTVLYTDIATYIASTHSIELIELNPLEIPFQSNGYNFIITLVIQ